MFRIVKHRSRYTTGHDSFGPCLRIILLGNSLDILHFRFLSRFSSHLDRSPLQRVRFSIEDEDWLHVEICYQPTGSREKTDKVRGYSPLGVGEEAPVSLSDER